MSGFADFLVSHHVPMSVTATEQPKGEDMFENNITSDIINLKNWGGAIWIIHKLAGTAGTATITVESCDTVVPGTATAVAFYYRKMTTNDTFGVWTYCASTGFTTTAGANQTYEVAISSSDLYKGTAAAPVNDNYVRLVCTEVDSTAVDGAVVTLLVDPKYAHEVPSTVLT